MTAPKSLAAGRSESARTPGRCARRRARRSGWPCPSLLLAVLGGLLGLSFAEGAPAEGAAAAGEGSPRRGCGVDGEGVDAGELDGSCPPGTPSPRPPASGDVPGAGNVPALWKLATGGSGSEAASRSPASAGMASSSAQVALAAAFLRARVRLGAALAPGSAPFASGCLAPVSPRGPPPSA